MSFILATLRQLASKERDHLQSLVAQWQSNRLYAQTLTGILINVMPEKRKYADRAEALKAAVAKRRRKIKAMVIQYKGGKCEVCGYDRCPDLLELHHLDPSTKKFGLGMGGLTRSWTRVKAEADKCVMLCANCHREIHAGVVQLSAVRRTETRGELREA